MTMMMMMMMMMMVKTFSVTTPPWERLRLDVRLVCLCHQCFPSSLSEGLRLDVRLVSLSLSYNMSLHRMAAAPLAGKYLNKNDGL
jgi:hypothetical protein